MSRQSLATKITGALQRGYVSSLDQAGSMSDAQLLGLRSFGVTMLAVVRDATSGRDAEMARLIVEKIAERTLLRQRPLVSPAPLTDRQRYILDRRLLATPRPTLTQVGAEIGLSRDRVRVIQRQAEQRLFRLQVLSPRLGGQAARDVATYWPVLSRWYEN